MVLEQQHVWWIQSVASVFTAVAVGIALLAYFHQRRVWLDVHERARREKAVQLLAEFTKNYTRQWNGLCRLVERLDAASLNCLEVGGGFSVPFEMLDLVNASLPHHLTISAATSVPPKTPVPLSVPQVYALQWEAYAFLNSVEIVLQAYYADVVDRNLIKTQLSPIYAPSAGRTVMRQFREIAGGEGAFPSIHAFILELESSSRRASDSHSLKPVGTLKKQP